MQFPSHCIRVPQFPGQQLHRLRQKLPKSRDLGSIPQGVAAVDFRYVHITTYFYMFLNTGIYDT